MKKHRIMENLGLNHCAVLCDFFVVDRDQY